MEKKGKLVNFIYVNKKGICAVISAAALVVGMSLAVKSCSHEQKETEENPTLEYPKEKLLTTKTIFDQTKDNNISTGTEENNEQQIDTTKDALKNLLPTNNNGPLYNQNETNNDGIENTNPTSGNNQPSSNTNTNGNKTKKPGSTNTGSGNTKPSTGTDTKKPSTDTDTKKPSTDTDTKKPNPTPEKPNPTPEKPNPTPEKPNPKPEEPKPEEPKPEQPEKPQHTHTLVSNYEAHDENETCVITKWQVCTDSNCPDGAGKHINETVERTSHQYTKIAETEIAPGLFEITEKCTVCNHTQSYFLDSSEMGYSDAIEIESCIYDFNTNTIYLQDNNNEKQKKLSL